MNGRTTNDQTPTPILWQEIRAAPNDSDMTNDSIASPQGNIAYLTYYLLGDILSLWVKTTRCKEIAINILIKHKLMCQYFATYAVQRWLIKTVVDATSFSERVSE